MLPIKLVVTWTGRETLRDAHSFWKGLKCCLFHIPRLSFSSSLYFSSSSSFSHVSNYFSFLFFDTFDTFVLVLIICDTFHDDDDGHDGQTKWWWWEGMNILLREPSFQFLIFHHSSHPFVCWEHFVECIFWYLTAIIIMDMILRNSLPLI